MQNHIMLSHDLVTAEELPRFAKDDYRYELVRGRVVRMSPVGCQHGIVVVRLAFLLQTHLRSSGGGVIMTDVGFKLASNPDTVRAPDLALIRRDRIPSPPPRSFWVGHADIAVEVLSPNDRAAETQDKVDEYLFSGTRLVVVVDPAAESVDLYRAERAPVTLIADDELTFSDDLPGFRCRVAELFE